MILPCVYISSQSGPTRLFAKITYALEFKGEVYTPTPTVEQMNLRPNR